MGKCPSCNDQNPKKNTEKNIQNTKELPMSEKVRNLTKSLVRHASNGFDNTSVEVREERRNICLGCPHMIDSGLLIACQQCGCFIDTKIAWSSEQCPIGLWGKDVPTKGLTDNDDENVPES